MKADHKAARIAAARAVNTIGELENLKAAYLELQGQLNGIAYGDKRGLEALHLSQEVSASWYKKYGAERKAREELQRDYMRMDAKEFDSNRRATAAEVKLREIKGAEK